MKKIIIFLFVFTATLHAQNPADKTLKEISGFVYYDNQPLSKVNISLLNDNKKGTITDTNGFFSINTSVGEILVFDYLGLKTVKIYIEDVTSTLNITMKTDYNLLDEISIKSNSKKDDRESKTNEVLRLGRSNVNVRSSGFGIKYISGESLNPGSFNVIRAIQGKAPGIKVVGGFGSEQLFLRASGSITSQKPVLWDVDGAILNSAPLIDVSQIVHIAILSSLGATNTYGADGAGGVVIISTKSDPRTNKQGKAKTNNYTNKEYYNSDATAFADIATREPAYLNSYDGILTSEEAYLEYKKQYDIHASKNNFHFNTLAFFQKKFKNKTILLKILSDFEDFSETNIEDLKAIAYKYQELNENEKALDIYKKIAKLRPNYAQSYRDLANTYLELKDYQNAWKIHKYYFIKGLKIENNDIGEVLNSEMISTYLQRKKDTAFKEAFKMIDADKILKSDVRFVFEWNTTEAEFIIEFVNANNQSFTVENSMDADNDKIIDQKLKGYTSKEFMLEKLENSPWLINLTYLGNKQYKPTIFKVTTYYNWGQINQSKKIRVFELEVENLKMQLLKLNSNGIMN